MAEEPGKLSRISDDDNTDAVSTAAGANDTYSVDRLGDYPTSETESRSLDAGDDNATDADATEDTEQIRAQIEQTRSQMGETIDAIQERLSMSNIKEQVSDQINSAVDTAKDAVYDATIGKAGKFMQNVSRTFSSVTGSVGRSLGDVTGDVGNTLAKTDVLGTVSRNPIPFALIGLGIGMLVLNARSRNSAKYSPSYSYDYDAGNYNEGDYDYDTELSGSRSRRATRSTLKSATRKVGGAASSAVSGVSSAAGSAVSGVSNAASSAYEGLTSAAGSAYEGIGSGIETVGTQARHLAGTAQDQYEYYIEENPLAVGAVALAFGAAVGFMIPSTQTENRLVGEYRDDLVSRAGDIARGALDKVQQVAGEVSRTVQEQAGDQGMVQ
jgi:ElaB/YqjD/DUF883 family membrane-anchored ribosome-binding protein